MARRRRPATRTVDLAGLTRAQTQRALRQAGQRARTSGQRTVFSGAERGTGRDFGIGARRGRFTIGARRGGGSNLRAGTGTKAGGATRAAQGGRRGRRNTGRALRGGNLTANVRRAGRGGARRRTR